MDKNETHCDETYDWLLDRRHQTVLKTMHTIAYEFNPETGEEIVSPFIHQYLAGNYDGRLLSQVMVEDQVIHPVIQMIQAIQFPVIAEGVESKEQADFLLNAGCTHAQGYYYAKPMTVSDFEQLLSGKDTAV